VRPAYLLVLCTDKYIRQGLQVHQRALRYLLNDYTTLWVEAPVFLNRFTALVVVIALAVGEIAITSLYVQYYNSLNYPAWLKVVLVTVLLAVVTGTPRAQIRIFRDVNRDEIDNRILVGLMLTESIFVAAMILYLVRSPH
jgi:hypothetical protein